MQKPIIGIVPRTEYVNTNYRVQVNYSYLEPFNKRDITPIILPLNSDNIEELLPLCSGFLVPGGDDINPEYYGEINEGDSKDVDSNLDKLDKIVLEYAVKHHVPTLGICRGIQSIAAFLGGTLHQDIKKAGLNNEEVDHKHMVTNTFNHPFNNLFPSKFEINSYHHQAVKKVPEDFVVTFMHNDIIEGITHHALPIIGVQWHPERFNTLESKIIFDYFANLVREFHAKRNL
jgi:putative glutamine amidotransferase